MIHTLFAYAYTSAALALDTWRARSGTSDGASVPFCRPVRGPYQSQSLAFRHLFQRHLRGDCISKPLVKIMLAPGRPRGRQIEPFVGKNDVFRHAMAPVVTEAEPALGEGIALLRRLAIEIGGCDVILRHAEAVFVPETQPSNRMGAAACHHYRLGLGSMIEILSSKTACAGDASKPQRKYCECFIEGFEHGDCLH